MTEAQIIRFWLADRAVTPLSVLRPRNARDPSYGQRGKKVNDINLAIKDWGKSYISAFQHTSMAREYKLINGANEKRAACRIYDEAKAGVKISNQ